MRPGHCSKVCNHMLQKKSVYHIKQTEAAASTEATTTKLVETDLILLEGSSLPDF
jgi:hypothetical protein